MSVRTCVREGWPAGERVSSVCVCVGVSMCVGTGFVLHVLKPPPLSRPPAHTGICARMPWTNMFFFSFFFLLFFISPHTGTCARHFAAYKLGRWGEAGSGGRHTKPISLIFVSLFPALFSKTQSWREIIKVFKLKISYGNSQTNTYCNLTVQQEMLPGTECEPTERCICYNILPMYPISMLTFIIYTYLIHVNVRFQDIFFDANLDVNQLNVMKCMEARWHHNVLEKHIFKTYIFVHIVMHGQEISYVSSDILYMAEFHIWVAPSLFCSSVSTFSKKPTFVDRFKQLQPWYMWWPYIWCL